MRDLTDGDLLAAWDRGLTRPPVGRALALLAAADPDVSPEDLAALSVGRRDARLLALRERAFGPSLVGLADCPGCGVRVELELSAPSLCVTAAVDPEPGSDGGFAFETAGLTFRLRPPDSRDLAAATAGGVEDAEAVRRLLRRCVLGARRGGEPVSLDDLSVETVAALAGAIAEADPQADIRVALTCPGCGAGWSADFDILSFFWAELQAWVTALLRDVHSLASAYGWSEREILSLSSNRRRRYLEMIAG